jgi:prepilin-type N-terminal cleavage/methylation domain-containing protein/prepilin-type processing-associated H-X9-DG protein
MRDPRRAGFTLIELLVVIAIIAVLIALLLPAVQSAREAARRAQCVNNLKQMALAMHNYLSANESFPAGGLYADDAFDFATGTVLRSNYTGWAVSILPFMEGTPLGNQYNFSVHNWDPINSTVVATKLNVQICPSDLCAYQSIASFVLGGGTVPYTNVAEGSYKGVAGRYTTNAGLTLFWDYASYVEAFAPTGVMDIPSRGILTASGVGGISTVKIAEILDGTSNTMLIGEYATIPPASNAPSAMWAVSWGYAALGSTAPSQCVRGLPNYNTCMNCIASNRCRRAFASFHPGGMNFAMADGHVVFIKTYIDANVYQALSTYAGNELVSADSY